MSISLIALDMDGTLLASDHAAIPRRNIDALRAAADRGVKVAIASGRSWCLIQEAARELGCVSYAVTCNGALVLDAVTGEVLVRHPFSPAHAAAVVDVLRRWNTVFEVVVDRDSCMQRSDLGMEPSAEFSRAFWEFYLRVVTVVPDQRELVLRRPPVKIDTLYVPDRDQSALVAELLATGPVDIVGSGYTELELTPSGVSKGRSLADLCGRLGLASGDVMAFGDADNDLEMLRWAGWSFAMANGSDEAKAAARGVAPPNDDAGVGQIVEQYILGA